VNSSISEPELPLSVANPTLPRERIAPRPPTPQATLERVPQDDPDAPPMFELRAEYIVAPHERPSCLGGKFARLGAHAGDLLLSAVYFLGLGAFAPLVRSRDPLRLTSKGATRWLTLPASQRDRFDTRR
jgi:hypothetical protein